MAGMNTTAKELSARAHARLHNLTQRAKSNRSVYSHLAQLSGLSISLIQQFHNGNRPNLTIETLDQLVEGINVAERTQDAA